VAEQRRRTKSRAAGILLGVGLGGFADGIALHQIAQWHNMLSARLPPHTMEAMRTNMTWDGLFHAATWLVTLAGLFLLYGAGKRPGSLPSTAAFVGQLVLGWGLFNLVEGVIDHHLLVLHNVREVPDPAIYNYTFLLVGGVGFILLGWLMMRTERRG
jgi:uncharacterized membrane protein